LTHFNGSEPFVLRERALEAQVACRCDADWSMLAHIEKTRFTLT
jgi:hypothetical protein